MPFIGEKGMPEFIDARGLGCAQPVLLARAALETHNEVIIDVDARIPVENITALARHTGYTIEVIEKPGNVYSIKLMKTSGKS
jgi:TusA-related sulfurtransferase